jgi:ABC-type phosphate transport system substrate-binding protein
VVALLGLSTTLVVGAGTASAAPSDPSGGAVPVAPHFYNGSVESIRGAGSDTTFFLMQRFGDLFTGAGLYGCSLNADTGANYNTSDPAPSTSNEEFFCQANDDIATTDVNDNWDRTVAEGVDDIGSTPGHGQLCGSVDTPLTVDFARSAKPAGSVTGCNMVETGFAKDGVPIIDYPVNPSVFGTSTSAAYLLHQWRCCRSDLQRLVT